jgi:hypothetical protein
MQQFRKTSLCPAYPLGVHLADVGQPLGQGITRHLVAVLVPELSCLGLRTLGEGAGVGDGSGNDAANRGGQLEDVGDGGGIDELVLGRCEHLGNACAGGDGIWLKRTGTFFWDRTTAESFPRTPIDMMFAAVMALKAYSGGRSSAPDCREAVIGKAGLLDWSAAELC